MRYLAIALTFCSAAWLVPAPLAAADSNHTVVRVKAKKSKVKKIKQHKAPKPKRHRAN